MDRKAVSLIQEKPSKRNIIARAKPSCKPSRAKITHHRAPDSMRKSPATGLGCEAFRKAKGRKNGRGERI